MAARGISQPELYRRAEGVSFETIRSALAAPDPAKASDKQKHRYPSADKLGAILVALDVDPATFPEYRLALARRELDEREVGLDQALKMLETIEAAMRQDRPRNAHLEAVHSPATGHRPPAGRPGRRKPSGA